MFKKALFALIPMVLVASSAMAQDKLFDDVANLDASEIQSAGIEIEDLSLDGLDVDELAANAGDDVDAIEASFRRFGYRRGYFGGGYGWNRFHNYGWNNCYRPVYRSFYCYRPVYRCFRPVYSYWGCY